MIAFGGWQFPDGETHFPAQLTRWHRRVDGRLTYQYPIYQQALAACGTRRGAAVDVGAHVGLWSYFMARDFAQVVAFEPVEEHRQCWVANMPVRPRDVLYPVALGAHPGSVLMTMAQPGTSGGTYISGQGPTPLRTLDSFDLASVDLLKVDCEGYEWDVIQGAEALIRRCRPVIAIEQRPKLVQRFQHGPSEAIDWLQQCGALVLWTDRRDYVLGFPRCA